MIRSAGKITPLSTQGAKMIHRPSIAFRIPPVTSHDFFVSVSEWIQNSRYHSREIHHPNHDNTAMYWYNVSLLPHARIVVLKNLLPGTYERWGIISHSLVTKIAPKHRAYRTYNISKARQIRINIEKVVLILLLNFIFPSHGSN